MTSVLLTGVIFALGLVLLLVAGLLRSHAEILRGLEVLNRVTRAGRAGPLLSPEVPLPPSRPEDGVSAPDAPVIVGRGLRGDAVNLALATGGQNTLIAFLSSGCATCHGFWEAFAPGHREALPGDTRLIVVTKDTTEESPSKLAQLAPADVPVIMSSAAWSAYAVPAAPYFVYVDGISGKIYGEGAAMLWDQVRSLLQDALLDASGGAPPLAVSPPQNASQIQVLAPQGESTAARNARADVALAAAGVSLDDPSFWGGSTPPDGTE